MSDSTTPVRVGAQLGRYVIEAPLGKGGMGEVFRARDTRLGRAVAIKVSDAQFSARFEREARAISALNHPHTCTLHDVGPNYLVMELVEGESLADRLKKGPLTLDETLRYGGQIADALDAAHVKSITHRDLKPGNIMISKTAGVKVLDFGLAKIRANANDTVTQSTIVMGTPAYMAPEQIQGKEADARTDIYALGLVLSEMVTGKRSLPGTEALRASIPIKLRHVVERCLALDPEERWQSARDIKAELQWLTTEQGEKTIEVRTSRKPWVLATFVMLFLLVATVWLMSSFDNAEDAAPQPFSFRVPIPSNLRMITRNTFSISPDGSTIAFMAARADNIEHVWVQRLGELESRLIPGTESPPYSPPPFWSPDSKTLVFYAGSKLKRIDLNGGAAEAICDVASFASGGSWAADDVILFADLVRGIMRVPASGGIPTPVTTLAPGERVHAFPVHLPGGRHFLYVKEGGSPDVNGVYIGATNASPNMQDSKRLIATDTAAHIVPLKDGSIKVLFLHGTTLMAQDLDVDNLNLIGKPVAVAEPVGSSLAFGFFAASNPTLVYRSPVKQGLQLRWFDRDKKEGAVVGEPISRQTVLSLSRDGQQALVSRLESTTSDIWLLELSREVFVRLTRGGSINTDPVWAPDGKRFAFSSSASGTNDLFQGTVEAESRIEALLQSESNKFPLSWSSDGKYLLYAALVPGTKSDLWILPIDSIEKGKAGTPFPFAITEVEEREGAFSPDGHWIVYVSDETGAPEVYVRSFVPPANGSSVSSGAKIRVSRGGGIHPRWSRDGKELFYSAPDGRLMAVAVSGSDALRLDAPRTLFSMAPNTVWDVGSDGKRFLVGVPIEENAQAPFAVVMNWMEGLKR